MTASGTHFRTTEALLTDFAGPVFDAEPLDRLVRRAEVWLRSPATLALWVLLGLLLVMPSWAASLLALAVYLGGAMIAPSALSRPLGSVLSVLERPLVQGVVFVVVLSGLGLVGDVAAVLVGLIAFVGFRLGVLQRVLRPVTEALQARLYPLPAPDQTLRAVIVRSALHHRVALPELEKLEASARKAWATKGREY